MTDKHFRVFWKWSRGQSRGGKTSSCLQSDSQGEARFELKIKLREKAGTLLSVLPVFLSGMGGAWRGRKCDVMLRFLMLWVSF